MTDKRQELRNAIVALSKKGNLVLLVELARKSPKSVEQLAESATKPRSKKPLTQDPEVDAAVSKLGEELRSAKDFREGYQEWYTEALRLVQQLLPDRYDEFRALYRVERRKELSLETYGIADYLAGVQITRLGQPEFDVLEVMSIRFRQQQAIVSSALSRLDSILADITGVLEASLFDTELDAARNLLNAKHIRSAGIISGVVLERHLKRLIENHDVTFRKTATLTNLNDALKTAGIYDVPQWRRIQLLADIRNLCGHSGDRDPTAEEVDDLIRGVDQVIHTIF